MGAALMPHALQVKKETDILTAVAHPNIVALYECIVMHGRMHFVMELCRGGDLFEVPVTAITARLCPWSPQTLP